MSALTLTLAPGGVPLRGVALDMGGVLLDMLGGNGLPTPDLDAVGRERLRRHLREATGTTVEDALLDGELFEPWRASYADRYRRRREAAWEPHLERLAGATGYVGDPLDLLGRWLRPYLDTVRPLPDTREAVASLAEEVPLVLVSNVPAPGRFYREVLDRHGLAAPFRRLLFSYDEGSRKPSPAMLLDAVASLGVPAAEVLMVGDRRDSDVAAGRAAGTRTAWLESDRDDGPEPDLQAADLPELVARLQA